MNSKLRNPYLITLVAALLSGCSAVAGSRSTSVSPTSIDFGGVTVNSTAQQAVTITNTGNSPLQIQSVSISGSNAFTIAGWPGKTQLRPSSTLQLTVNFSPTSAASFTGALNVQTNASSQNVPLSASGLSPAPTPTTVTIAISPTTASLQASQSKQFTATVSGSSNTTVNWLVNNVLGGNATAGTISATGVYNAPAVVSSTTSVMVTAQSAADSTKTASAGVTVSPAPAPVPVSVSVSPSTAILQTGVKQQFTATVSGTTNTAVTWAADGVVGGNTSLGTISSAGLYTAPSVSSTTTETITATSVADTTKSGSATVSVAPPSPAVTVGISPTNPSVQTGGTLQFSASVSGTTNTAVTWFVSGVQAGNTTVGTITSSGLYTAPSTIPSSAPVVKAASAADPSQSASATVTITTPPPPPSSGTMVYGGGIGGNSLANTQVGGTDCGCGGLGARSAYRFRAAVSSTLPSIRIFFQDGTGYSGGNGGQIRVELQTDDGTSSHRPSGSVLASATVAPGNPVANHWPVITFNSTPQLTAGQLYHVVFTNVDASPTTNFMSVNGVYDSTPTTPMQPEFADSDWAQLISTSGSWSARPITPVMQLNYGSGTIKGVGYMESWISSQQSVSGASKVGEIFTVTGSSRTVSGAGIRLARSSGSSALTIRLEDANGNLIDQGTVPASSIDSSMHWVSARFSAPQTLSLGQTYRLVLSAPADTVYKAFPLRDGTSFGFSKETVFADGYAQFNTGSGWVGWTMWGQSNRTDGDLQFYFLP
jgi:hypothetical protein